MIEPLALSNELIDADRTWFGGTNRKVGQDHCNMPRSRHHRIGLIGMRLATTARMDMNIRDNTITPLAA